MANNDETHPVDSTGIGQRAQRICKSLHHMEVFDALDSSDQYIAEAASRALIIVEHDGRFKENESFYEANYPSDAPYHEKALLSAVEHSIKIAESTFRQGFVKTEFMLVNAMNIQNDGLTVERLNKNQKYNGDFDMLANGHLMAKIENSKASNLTVQEATKVAHGNLDGIEEADLKTKLSPQQWDYLYQSSINYFIPERVSDKPGEVKTQFDIHTQIEHQSQSRGHAAPIVDIDQLRLETVKQAAAGEAIPAYKMKALGYHDYPQTSATKTPDVENDKQNRETLATIGKSATIVEKIAYEHSRTYDMLRRMKLTAPRQSNEVARALGTHFDRLRQNPQVKDNALDLLTATESQHSAKMMLRMVDAINYLPNDQERLERMNKEAPGIVKHAKLCMSDPQITTELTKLAAGAVSKLDREEVDHYSESISKREGITSAQIGMVEIQTQQKSINFGRHMAAHIAQTEI